MLGCWLVVEMEGRLPYSPAHGDEAERLAKQLLAGATPEEGRALLDSSLSGRFSSILEKLQSAEPTLRSAPTEVRGFRVRLDLHGAKPPVWRRLELPGDLTLPRLHDVIQAVMGWTDSHLHRFRTGSDHRSPYFVTTFDLDEGEDGMPEDDVRLDQLVAAEGDALWYEYDFGDGWDHVLRVAEILDDPPAHVRCTDGRKAGPPEDCGGIGGYAELASWVRSGYDDDLLPDVFEDAAHAHDWLPPDWDPDHFDWSAMARAESPASSSRVAVVLRRTWLVTQGRPHQARQHHACHHQRRYAAPRSPRSHGELMCDAGPDTRRAESLGLIRNGLPGKMACSGGEYEGEENSHGSRRRTRSDDAAPGRGSAAGSASQAADHQPAD